MIPLYCGYLHFIGRRTKTNEFCLNERLTNAVFDGWPALFEMFNILVGPIDDTGRQNICCPPDIACLHSSVALCLQNSLTTLQWSSLNSIFIWWPIEWTLYTKKGPFHGTMKYDKVSQQIIKICWRVLESGTTDECISAPYLFIFCWQEKYHFW